MTQIPGSSRFQRDIGANFYTLPLSGTYRGRPTGVEARVSLDDDDSVVVDWMLIDSNPHSRQWSGEIEVPSGGPYRVDVRAQDAPSVIGAGGTTFEVGVWLALYGQSNMTIFAVHGAQSMCDSLRDDLGIPFWFVDGSDPGASIAELSEGTESFTHLLTVLDAATDDAEFVLWYQGESDFGAGISPTRISAYQSALDEDIHAPLAAHVGRTKAQMPLVLCGLATSTGTLSFYGEYSWAYLRKLHLKVAENLTSVTYSHSNHDLTKSDSLHIDAAGAVECGERFAQTIKFLLGDATAPAVFFISAANIVDATHTDVTIVHGAGTDITPTSGITGFDVSDDNGSSWVAATGARQDATTIRLTHASAGNVRHIRHMYGAQPDVSVSVKDNSESGTVLAPQSDPLLCANATSVPLPVFQFACGQDLNGANQTYVNIELGAPFADRLVIVAVPWHGAATLNSANFLVDGESPIAATIVATGFGAIVQAIVPEGEVCSLQTAWAASMEQAMAYVYTVDATKLNSTTPVDALSISGTGTSLSGEIETEENGFTIAVTKALIGDNAVFSGDGDFVQRSQFTWGGGRVDGSDAALLAANVASEITVTHSGSGTITLTAGSWR